MTAAAAEALGTLGDERAIKVIIQELKRSNDTYKSTIVKALAAFGALAVPPLVESLKQGWRLGDEWNSVRSSVEPAFLALSAPVREALVAELDQTQNYELFVDIVAILEKMDGGLDSRKAQAARLIVKKSWAEVAEMGPEAQGILTSLLRSRLEDKNLVKTLVKIWGCNASDELINLLQDKSLSPFHEHAVEALGELGDERAIPFLAALLQSPDVSIYVREKALRAIRLFNTPPAIQALERLLELANSPTMRSAAADALDQWHWKPGSDRLRAVYLITRQEWGQFLGLARPVINQVVEDLLGLVKTRSGSVLDVIHSLGMIGDPRATEALTVILEDLDEKLRLAACEALGLIGDARALAPLEKVAKNDYYLSDDPVNNPYKYDHTGGSNDYWSSGSDEYPVRNAALRAINLITHKPPITQPEN
jgi:HEAT repeat protein